MGDRGQGLANTVAVGKAWLYCGQFPPTTPEPASDIPVTGFALVPHRLYALRQIAKIVEYLVYHK